MYTSALTRPVCAMQGVSCLMWAAGQLNYPEVVKFLLYNGADILDKDHQVVKAVLHSLWQLLVVTSYCIHIHSYVLIKHCQKLNGE